MRDRELLEGITHLPVVAGGKRAAAENTTFHNQGDIRENLARLGRKRVQGGDFAAGQRWQNQARTAVADFLDGNQEQKMRRLLEAALRGKGIGVPKQKACLFGGRLPGWHGTNGKVVGTCQPALQQIPHQKIADGQDDRAQENPAAPFEHNGMAVKKFQQMAQPERGRLDRGPVRKVELDVMMADKSAPSRVITWDNGPVTCHVKPHPSGYTNLGHVVPPRQGGMARFALPLSTSRQLGVGDGMRRIRVCAGLQRRRAGQA